jgi:hypothetical protein
MRRTIFVSCIHILRFELYVVLGILRIFSLWMSERERERARERVVPCQERDMSSYRSVRSGPLCYVRKRKYHRFRISDVYFWKICFHFSLSCALCQRHNILRLINPTTIFAPTDVCTKLYCILSSGNSDLLHATTVRPSVWYWRLVGCAHCSAYTVYIYIYIYIYCSEREKERES